MSKHNAEISKEYAWNYYKGKSIKTLSEDLKIHLSNQIQKTKLEKNKNRVFKKINTRIYE